jgi:hypothetical protein
MGIAKLAGNNEIQTWCSASLSGETSSQHGVANSLTTAALVRIGYTFEHMQILKLCCKSK